jgi:hypothetical protein
MMGLSTGSPLAAMAMGTPGPRAKLALGGGDDHHHEIFRADARRDDELEAHRLLLNLVGRVAELVDWLETMIGTIWPTNARPD